MPRLIATSLSAFLVCAAASAQSLDDRLDEDKFLRGLSELQLPEVLEKYIAAHPSADPANAASFQIAAQRMVIDAPATSDADRRAAIDRMLQVRAALIKDHPQDSRRAVWLADQAADLYFVFLPLEASDLTVEFGLPTPQQTQTVKQAAAQIRTLADEAELAIEEAIVDVEAAPGYAKDVALQIKRRRLARDERERRIPFLRGVGAYLDALLNITDEPQRQKLFQISADILPPLADQLEGSLASQARIYGGLALAQLHKADEAEVLFKSAATDPQSTPSDIFRARMGAVQLRVISSGPDAGMHGLDDVAAKYAAPDELFFRLLIADQRFLLHRALAEKDSPAYRPAKMAEAMRVYTDLLEKEKGVPRDTVRALVLKRLILAADANAPLDQLPAIVTIARAEQLASESASRAQAIDLYAAVLKRTDLQPTERTAAMFGQAHALFDDNHPADAAKLFFTLARDFPADPQAPRAIELAASIQAEAFQKNPADKTTQADLQATLALLEKFPRAANLQQWRYLSARLALAQSRFDDAISIFAAIQRDAPVWVDAQFMRISAMASAVRAQTETAGRLSRSRAVLEAAPPAAKLIEAEQQNASDPQRVAAMRYYLAFLRVFQAEAQLAVGEPETAIKLLDGIESDRTLDSSVIAEALRTRIAANQAAGRSDALQSELAKLMSISPDAAGPVIASALESVQRDVLGLIEKDRADGANKKAQQELLPLAKSLDTWLRGRSLDPAESVRLRRLAADGYRLAQQHAEALRIYDELVKSSPDSLEILFGRAESLFGLGGDGLADAMGIYKRIGATREKAADDYFWQSQLRMLQILDITNRSTQQIAPRIGQLSQKDPQLGGDRFRREFDVLRRKYK